MFSTHKNFGEPSEEERASNKRRRLRTRSEEEFDDEKDHHGWYWRHGWPSLPIPPLKTIRPGANILVPDFAKILQTVSGILELYRIRTSSVYFAFRVPKEVNRKDIEYLTLVCVVDMGVHTKDELDKPLIIIRKQLQKHEVTDGITIEFVDKRAEHGLKQYPFSAEEASIVDAWHDHSHRMAEDILGDVQWSVIECTKRGTSIEKAKPTVVITSPTADDPDWWTGTLPALRKYIQKNSLPFEVELLQLRSVLLGNGPGNLQPVLEDLDEMWYHQEVWMGSSIGSAESNGSGSVGGVIVLRDPQGREERYALSNFHVVRSEKMTVEKGVAFPEFEKKFTITRPSDDDHEWLVKRTKDAINLLRGKKNPTTHSNRYLTIGRAFLSLHTKRFLYLRYLISKP